MVIMVSRVGQLGNNLFRFAHAIANSLAYDYPLLNTTFNSYQPFFEATRHNNFGPARVSLGQVPGAVLGRVAGLLKYKPLRPALLAALRLAGHRTVTDHDRVYDMNQPPYLALAKQPSTVMVGWLFRDDANFVKYAPQLRRMFAPVQPHREQVEHLAATIRPQCDVLVGIHIRRGDYADFAGGKYFYSHQTYADKMRQIEALFGQNGQRVGFLLCSNEPIEEAVYQPFTTFKPTGHFIEDMYALATCDYIAGPPSTYSTWASFYGEVPICIIQSAEQDIAAQDFQVFYT